MKSIFQQPFFIKLFNWEYWPFNVVYGPIYIYWLWLCCKARAVFFFNTSNPAIKNGGFLMESKKEIYDLLPRHCYPATLLFEPLTNPENILEEIQRAGMHFPLIAKPDIGMRGLCVQKVNAPDELAQYARQSKVKFLVQAFVPLENEVGIFYYRYPNQERGKISGIVGKEFLSVTGNGISSIEELLQRDPRFILQLKTFRATHAHVLPVIPALGEQHLLVPYGNHSRGAKFIDITHLNDTVLTTTIDDICQQIPGFYFGRMDIRFSTWEELKKGNFSIIELNGAGSEPTHMYDPSHSIFFAWKEIIRHWIILYKISQQNHRRLNLPYMKFSEGLRMLKENTAYIKVLNASFQQEK